MRSTNSVVMERGTLQSGKKAKHGALRWKITLPLLLLVLIASAAGYWYWSQIASKTSTATTTTTASAATKTNTVKSGDITVSAAGSGTLVASQQTALSFSTTGTIATVNVAVGDNVKKGQVLAQLADLTSLQTNIDVAKQNLILAQQNLTTLKNASASNLATAQLAVATTQKALTDAQSALVQKGVARCDQATIDLDYQKYMLALNHLNTITAESNGSQDYYLTYVVPAKDSAAQAYSVYVWCGGYTTYEVDSSHANLAIAQANVQTTQTTLTDLQKNNGVDPINLATAQQKVSSAQVALDSANQTLDGATIKAPYDGVILSVAGLAGDTVTTGTFISIADFSNPKVKFYIDETDMNKLSVGETATISFDAITNRKFSGKVTQITPALQTVNNYQVVQGLIELNLANEKNVPTLVAGMNVTVEVINGQAKNVLLVPVAALKDLGDGSYSVFVVGTGGKTSMKAVEVGLQDAASAEIKSGLKAGDVVTTGIVQTK
jgi:HlyD family secretion protein